jgi:hypothetical protein
MVPTIAVEGVWPQVCDPDGPDRCSIRIPVRLALVSGLEIVTMNEDRFNSFLAAFPVSPTKTFATLSKPAKTEEISDRGQEPMQKYKVESLLYCASDTLISVSHTGPDLCF